MALVQQLPPAPYYWQALLFLLASAGIAALGYFINDWYDREADARAGKQNYIGRLTLAQRTLFFGAALMAAVLPWLWLPFRPVVYGLLGVQLLLYLAYSHPAIRFKEKGVWGVLCDALYGHVNPALVALLTFYQGGLTSVPWYVLLAIIAGWQLLKGIRNIMAHQLDDRHRDRRAGLQTFINQFGAGRAMLTINSWVLPLEGLLLLAFCAYAAFWGAWLLWPVLLVFVVLNALKFSIWKLWSIHRRHFATKFLFFLNDFYESYMPVALLIGLVMIDRWYALLLAGHLLLMPQTWVTYKNDITTALAKVKEAREERKSQ